MKRVPIFFQNSSRTRNMASSGAIIYEFADFRLIPSEGLLLQHGKPVSLSLKAFSTLVLLVERHGHLVSKSELVEAVWSDSFVEEAAVSRCVWAIRNALGEESKSKTYIQTVSRRGYRFVAPVVVHNDLTVIGAGEAELTSTGFRLFPPAISEPEQPPGSLQNSEGARHRSEHSDGNAQQDVLASEFRNGSNDEFIGSGQVALWRRSIYVVLIVAICGGAAMYLNLDRLTDKKENASSARFAAKSTDDIFSGGTDNAEASSLYFQAMNLSEERGIQNLQRALEYLERAVELDPNYALAWAGIAHMHRDIVGHTNEREQEHYAKSMNAISKALAIDPNSSEAYSALCHNKLRYEYDIPGAEAACKKAVELDPRSPKGRKIYAYFLSSRGRTDEAIAEIKTAMDLQPVSYNNQQIYALALHFGRRYEAEEAQWRRLIELNPNHSFIYGRLSICLRLQGKETEAFEFLIKQLLIEKANVETIERFKAVYAATGWPGVLREQINSPEIQRRPGYYNTACMYAGLGDKDKAFENLERAFVRRSSRMAMLEVEPQLDPIRDDPRYDQLVRRVWPNR